MIMKDILGFGTILSCESFTTAISLLSCALAKHVANSNLNNRTGKNHIDKDRYTSNEELLQINVIKEWQMLHYPRKIRKSCFLPHHSCPKPIRMYSFAGCIWSSKKKRHTEEFSYTYFSFQTTPLPPVGVKYKVDSCHHFDLTLSEKNETLQ